MKEKVKVRRSGDCQEASHGLVLRVNDANRWTRGDCEPGTDSMNVSCMIGRLKPNSQEDREDWKRTRQRSGPHCPAPCNQVNRSILDWHFRTALINIDIAKESPKHERETKTKRPTGKTLKGNSKERTMQWKNI